MTVWVFGEVPEAVMVKMYVPALSPVNLMVLAVSLHDSVNVFAFA